MPIFNRGVCVRIVHLMPLVASVMLTVTPLAFAQGSGTFNGRVVDTGDAVLPGVTITATNTATGVVRTTVTSGEGLYTLPGLNPGSYTITADLTGFARTTLERVELVVNQTTTHDFKLGLAAVTENITVAGASQLIEVTQSKVSATIRTQEVSSLPLITRNINGLLGMLPGAKPVAAFHAFKVQTGSVSFGGSTGRNLTPVVDGADNRDNIIGGALISYTLEGVQEFNVASHQFSAADGRSSGAALTMVTKSGTNALRGSGFVYNRDRSLTKKDYFTARDNLSKLPYTRQQFGGSIGGPIVRNHAFFFGAVERVREDKSITVPARQYNELQLLVPFGAEPATSISQPFRDTLATIKTQFQVSPNHSLVGRFAGQHNFVENGSKTQANDLAGKVTNDQKYWDVVLQHSWVIGPRVFNQLTLHAGYSNTVHDTLGVDGRPMSEWPNATPYPITSNLRFPSVSIGSTSGVTTAVQNTRQIRNDATLQVGTHALKFGGGYTDIPPDFGGYCCRNEGSLTFFDDPSVILSNSNGRYPQGFQTPGIVRLWGQGAAFYGNFYGIRDGIAQVQSYVQDDWRIRPRLTLNLGLRYDVDLNFYNQKRNADNLTGQVLRAIGSPYGGFPQTPTKDFSPRVGFAYDFTGDGRRVLRSGYGLYYDGTGLNSHFASNYQANRPLSFDASLINTSIGVGQLPTFRFGIDPLPTRPPDATQFPAGASSNGYWLDPQLTDPHNHQVHVGYSHELRANTALSVDFTHIEGRNDFKLLEINPLVNGTRRLAPALAAVFGDPNLMGPVRLEGALGQYRYDELAIQLERRMPRATFRATYTLSGAFAYGGEIAGTASYTPFAQDQGCAGVPVTERCRVADILSPGEWGPTVSDERHRIVLFGVFELPWGFQVSPIFQAATPRPYPLVAGLDLNQDALVTTGSGSGGGFNDRYVDPTRPGTFQACPSCPVLQGQQVPVNSERGDPFVLLDLRMTKFFQLARENRRLGVFAEVFNLFNTANFGQNYQSNARSTVFKQPIGFIPGSGYPFQLQLGARVEF